MSRLQTNHRSMVQSELCRPENKNPFKHVGKIELCQSYQVQMEQYFICKTYLLFTYDQKLGEKDDILEAEKFNDVMMDLVRFSLVSRSHSTVPAGLDPVEDINSCIERTRSGLVLSKFTFRAF